MGFLFLGLAGLCGLACFVCWIITLVYLFPESVGKGLFGLICGLYAFIWAWQNRDRTGSVPVAWTIALVLGIVLRVAGAAVSGRVPR